MRRWFSRKERQAIHLAADGKSDASGKPLGDDFHADHKIPFAAGGETDVANAQALTPGENMEKSSRHVELRGWQKKFIRLWLEKQSKDFLLAALPGAGKTIAALEAARLFLERHENGRIVIVVPSVNLRDQWQKEAWETFGISLQSKEFYGTLKSDHRGAVVTYQTVGNSPLVFRAIVSRQPTMVIFDEIHHAGDEKSWGDAILSAFENAEKRLALSGTPFRTDGKKIPFIEYEHKDPPAVEFSGMYAKADESYDYPDAIRDEVVRVVSFDHHAGEIKYTEGGENKTASIDPDVTEQEAKDHLRKLLSAGGQWVKSLLGKAHNKLMDLRLYKPDAAGLILCVDSEHAMSVARTLREVTGLSADVVLSDDELANSSVGAFRESSRPWIVAVRQVSEGVDIKRLQVLCYLTNTATELFFRQAIGRIVRNQGTEFDNDAFCYLPADPRLIEMAMRILKWQGEALQDDAEEYEREQERKDREEFDNEITILETSEADSIGLIIEGRQYTPDDAAFIRKVSQDAAIPQIKVALLMRLGLLSRSPQQSNENKPKAKTTRVETKPPEKVALELRKTITYRVSKLSKLLGKEYKEIHSYYRRHVCNIPQSDLSIDQLKEKIKWLDQQIKAASSTPGR